MYDLAHDAEWEPNSLHDLPEARVSGVGSALYR